MGLVTSDFFAEQRMKDLIEISVRHIIQGDAEEIRIASFNDGLLNWCGDDSDEYISPMKNIYVAEAGETEQEAYQKLLDILDFRLKARDFILWRSLPEITKIHKFEYGKDFFLITARYSIPDVEAIQ